jgi:hypothetical protein
VAVVAVVAGLAVRPGAPVGGQARRGCRQGGDAEAEGPGEHEGQAEAEERVKQA